MPRIFCQGKSENAHTGIVEPHFRYFCCVWGCCGSTEINQLQKLQNRAARIVTDGSFDTPNQTTYHRAWLEDHNTGNDVRLSKKNSANGQTFFSLSEAKLWNSLSAERKQVFSLKLQKVYPEISAEEDFVVGAEGALGWWAGLEQLVLGPAVISGSRLAH